MNIRIKYYLCSIFVIIRLFYPGCPGLKPWDVEFHYDCWAAIFIISRPSRNIVLDFFWPPIIYVWRPLDNKNKSNVNTYSFFSGCQFKNAIIAVLFFNETSFICHSFIWKGLNFSPQLKKKKNRVHLWKIMKSICCRDRLVVPKHYLQLRLLRKRKPQSHHTVSLTSSTRAAICLLLSNVRWHRGQPLVWTSSLSSLDTYLE